MQCGRIGRGLALGNSRAESPCLQTHEALAIDEVRVKRNRKSVTNESSEVRSTQSLDAFLPEDVRARLAKRRRAHQQGIANVAARKAAREYALARHSQCTCSFLSGSYAEENASPMSDVDIFVLDERAASPAREQIWSGGYALQVNLMTTAYALRLIESDRIAGTLIYLPAFAVAEFLTGHRDAFEVIKRSASETIARGAPPANPTRIARARIAVINNYLKLYREADAVERFGSCVKLVRSIATYLQLSSGSWVLNEVRYEPVLRDSGEYAEVVGAVPAALAGDAASLLSATHSLLRRRGEVVWNTEETGLLPL